MSRCVIKFGGSVLSDDSLRPRILDQIKELWETGFEVILVHGGGKQIGSLLDRLNIESKFHDGLRITDRKTLEAAKMVLAGQVGKDIVAELAGRGIRSAGITGGDGLSFPAEKLPAEDGTDLGFVGRIVSSDSAFIDAMISSGIMPVIACLAIGVEDQEYYNINGDQMAAAVAAGCNADTLVFVTDVGGVLDGNGDRIQELTRESIKELMDSGVAAGGMRPKLRACLEALDSVVSRINIVGAAEDRSIVKSLMNEERIGTRIT